MVMFPKMACTVDTSMNPNLFGKKHFVGFLGK